MKFDKQKSKFQFLGIGKQEAIKYFFGGNASLAIFILALICLFLFKEAKDFIPDQHVQLQAYRKAGVEVYSIIDREYQQFKIHTGALNRAWSAEMAHPNQENEKLIAAYEQSRIFVQRELGHKLVVLKDAIKQRKDVSDDSAKAKKLDGVIDSLKGQIDELRPELEAKLLNRKFLGIIPDLPVVELKEISKQQRQEVVDAVMSLEYWERGEADYYNDLLDKYDDIYDQIDPKNEPLYDLFTTYKMDVAAPLESVWKEAFDHTIDVRNRADSNLEVPKQVQGQMNVALNTDDPAQRKIKFASVMRVITKAEFFDEYARRFYLHRFRDALRNLEPGEDAYESIPSDIREPVEALLASGEEADSPYSNWIAYLEGESVDVTDAIPAGDMAEDLRANLLELAKLETGNDPFLRRLTTNLKQYVSAFPFDEESKKTYALIDRYQAAIASLKENGLANLEKFPDPNQLTTDKARQEYADFRKLFVADIKRLEGAGKKLEKWRHDRSWTYFETLKSFFLGTEWTNNSRVQDRYGILPMFFGSLIISIIALIVAVPLSIAGAVYVNQIAPFKEQSFLKPTIEFIGAIPSVVLGFLGIMVVGQLLKDLSGWTIFQYLPGFPIDQRLNMLLAGVLLGFMAVPIIFTLAEDALNNVPQAFRDGSLSLGATRLQTAFRVVLPASLSGVIAAVLLGFGRVIGETMVVLLVAGNRIAMPDFSKGLGVVTEPSHTMTGIIAQGMGEAAVGSVDYRALFMVGLVLFTITLVINYIGQRILTKYQSF